MLAEYDEIRSADRLSGIELFEKMIGRRTGRTTLGGEKFYEYRRIAPGRQCPGCEQRKSDGNRQLCPSAPPNRVIGVA
jgi:hypothetical protein